MVATTRRELTALASVVSGTHFCFRDLHRSHALLVRVCFRLSVVVACCGRESVGRRVDAMLSEELTLVLAIVRLAGARASETELNQRQSVLGKFETCSTCLSLYNLSSYNPSVSCQLTKSCNH